MQLQELAALILERKNERGTPLVVGVSGYGGAGKSTLARELVELVPGSVRMRGDDFLDPVRSHRRSQDWDGVERTRLVREVLLPFRRQSPSMFRRFDWSTGALAEPQPVPTGDVMVIDLVGLFHPEALGALDLTIWCDLDLAIAGARGIKRDADLGRDHSRLWHEVWIPNERDFDANFGPRERANVRYPTD
jgi:uridine kinase